MAADKKVALDVGVTTSGTENLDALAQDLRNVAAETKAARTAEAAAAAEVAQQVKVRNDQTDALKRLRAESTAATRSTAEYQAALTATKLAEIDANAALREKRAALKAASDEAKRAAAAERELRNEIAQATTAAQQRGDAARKSLAGIADGIRTIQTAAAALVGGQLLGGFVGSLAKTSDELVNLQARIRLATGEGAAFDAAFKGIQEVAERTNTSLSSTGELFTRILTAGKAIGVTSADALRLTETINQSLIVSGASAESSSAAITQLLQGLQSGVLRGEEFNSVLEQSPRLAKALADGYGVTIGELRKLAEAGQLTRQSVISALQGQSATIQAEFDRMPLTIGRAIQSLSNSWTVYIGQAGEASGASATVAKAIDAVSKNLDTLGSLLAAAGKTAIAFKAVRIAQEFVAVSTAAKVATTEVAAYGAAQAAANAASGAGAANVSRFAALLGGLKLGGLLLILTNLREIGTALGEGAAKLAGYGKELERLEAQQKADEAASRANAAAKAELAQKMQLAADKAFGLSDASRKLIGDFIDFVTKGGEVSSALEKISKALELGNMDGIRNAVTALDALEKKGLITGAQVRDALGGALKNEDLNVFLVNATAAFDQTEQGARRLKAAIDAIAEESARRAGTSLQELTSGFSKGVTSSINDVDAFAGTIVRLGLVSDDSRRALAALLDKALSAANTERAVQAVTDRIAEFGKQGLLTGEQVAGAMERIRQKVDDLKPAINSVDEAFRTFGLQAEGAAKARVDREIAAFNVLINSRKASLADLERAFQQMAETATRANGGIEPEAIKVARAMLEIKRGAEDAGKGIEAGMQRGGRAVDSLTNKLLAAASASQSVEERNRKIGEDSNKADADRAALNHTAADNTGLDSLKQKLANGTLSANDLATAQAVYDASKANLTTYQQNSTSYSMEGAASAQGDFNAARNLLAQVKALVTTSGASDGAGTSTTHNVTITLPNGTTRTINAASANDASALADLLGQLGDAKTRAA